MDKRDIKNFKITSLKVNGATETYLFKFRGDSTIDWSWKLFYLYARSKWPTFQYELNDEYSLTEAKLKENKAKYLELIKNFINDIKFNDKHYYIDTFKATGHTHFMGSYNKESFYIDKDDIITITSPSFKDIDLRLKYYFEKEFYDANFYLNKFVWLLNEDAKNPYANDKEFVKELEKVLETSPNKLKYINNNSLKEEIVIKPLLEQINYLENKDIKEILLNKVKETNLSISEVEKLESFVDMVEQINRLENSTIYTNDVVNNFKNFLDKNEYLKKPYVNSISKDELVELLNYKENDETEKSTNLKKHFIYRFFKDNQKEFTKMFLENNISKTPNQVMLEPELEMEY